VVTATLGDANGVDHLVLGEDGVDGDLLLEVLVAPVDLLVNGTTVDLDLDEVSLLLAEGESTCLFTGTLLQVLLGTVWQFCLGTSWQFSLGTAWQLCLGTC